jgi:hypothetical protein
MPLADYQTLTDSLVRDDSGEITAGNRDQAIALAVIRYSTDRPRSAVEAASSSGDLYLDLPSGWEADFSRLTAVRIPDAGTGKAGTIGAVLEQGLSGWNIRLERPFSAGDVMHVHFTIAHQLGESEDTIPLRDREAVSGWAAALLLEQLSSLYSGHRQPTIQADSVDWQSKGRDFAMRAKRFRESYLNHLGIDPKRTVPAGVSVNFDQFDSRGHDRLVHRQGRR